ncbi:NUDIX domain-containing protein [Flavobacteriaceae bacterium R38]|nr:NUDIX domain-containing protein [Flavobacteriaceae bacterium R38]
MNFDIFLNAVSKITNLPLPGQESHYKMAPLSRVRELKAKALEKGDSRKAAVLMLCYPDEANQTRFVLILRKKYPGVHSNQVAFPGGKIEENDKTLQETALREANEEVGVNPSSIEILRSLTEVYIPPSNFLVYPFLGVTRDIPLFKPQEDEVEDVIEVLLSDFLDDRTVFSQELTTSYAKKINVPAFKLNGHTVWGATAMMLNEVKDLLKSVY